MNSPKNILLVQLYSNGDCLYATAVARQIKQDYPGCKLTWQIASFCSRIIEGNPYVDEVIIVNDQKKNDIIAFRRLKKKVLAEKKKGVWDEVFITHNMDSNQALYDGTIRGMVFRAYPNPVTVPVQPVLVLNEDEINRVKSFAELHGLKNFTDIILWEFAPQSGQSELNFDFVYKVAKQLTTREETCVILSSAISFTSSSRIIDASTLTVRENAALTHYCTLLIGCSSGITWLSTSSAAKPLPMLQLLNGQAYFRNAPSVDFNRYGLNDNQLIEMVSYNESKILDAVRTITDEGFDVAKKRFNQALPVQFNTTRKIVYNLLCYLQFGAIRKHYRITTSLYGRHPEFIKQLLIGIFSFPFKLIRNKLRKLGN